MKIVIRMPRWVGDLVMATPVIEDVRHKFPDAEITVMAPKGVADLLRHDPNIDALFTFSPPSGWLPRQPHRDIIGRLREGKYDIGLLLAHSFSSAWQFWRAKVKDRVGYNMDGRGCLLTKRVRRAKDFTNYHRVEDYKRVATGLGIPVSDTMPKIHLTDSEIDNARSILTKYGVPEGAKVVGISPGAANGTAKQWLPSSFCAVAQKLLVDPDVHVVLVGDPGQIALCKEICAGLPERVVSLAGGTSLRELCALIAVCNAFLANDSGPMHIAAAVQTPVLAIFGPTSEVESGPYGKGKHGVIRKKVECSPCHLRECPIDHRCMTKLTPNEVYESLVHLIEPLTHSDTGISQPLLSHDSTPSLDLPSREGRAQSHTIVEQNQLRSSPPRMNQTLSSLHRLMTAPPPIPAKIAPFTNYTDVAKVDARVDPSRIGCLLVAGGQGSRLGHSGPKGTFEVAGKPLFEWIVEGVAGRLAIMTSPENDAETRQFFSEYLPDVGVDFFVQGELPMLDDAGEPTGQMGAMGNGGVLRNFMESGIDWPEIDYFNIIFVDNPINDPFDVTLVGYLEETGGDVAVKCVRRRAVDEKVGLLVDSEGATRVVEFAERRPEMADVDAYPAAAISMAVTREFANKAAKIDLSLHVTRRQGYKFEQFLFDLLSHAEKVVALLYPREACFAPIKSRSDVDFVVQSLLSSSA